MTILQPHTVNFRRVTRNATLVCAILLAVAACSDLLGSAGRDGAAAEQHLANGNVAAARQAINRAILESDDMVELYLLKGRIELAANSQATAYDAFSDAVSLDPANREALQAVSQLGLSTGHLAESFNATERILSLDPGSSNGLVVRGIHALIRRRHDEAIEYANKVLERSPRREDAAILKARALFLKGDHQAALVAVAAAGIDKGASVAFALTKLEIFRELRSPDAMAEQFRALRKLRPDDGQIRLDEANMRFKLNERSAAHNLVSATLAGPRTSPDLVELAIDLWREYGASDVQGGQFELIAKTGTPAAREAVVRFLIESGQLAVAGRLLPTLAGDSRNGLAARLETQRGQHASALKLANSVLARDATHCDALIAQSEARLGTGDAEAALISGQTAVAECPNQPASWITAARSYLAWRRSSGAERVYRQAIEAYPQNLRLAREHSEWLLSEGRNREAVATARRLTRNAPALLSGWRYYADVCRRAGADCGPEAGRGLENAQTMYGVDPEPGASLSYGLVGRLRR